MPSENPLRRQKDLKLYERTNIARQVKSARKTERGPNPYPLDRSFVNYFFTIGGFSNFFDYARSLPSNLVLDIGTGNGVAARGIANSPLALDLDIHVTSLQNTPQLQSNIQRDKIHITPVETLRGVKNNSVAAILSMGSLGYVEYPNMAIDRIDQVLIPGGVLKATFPPPDSKGTVRGMHFKTAEIFLRRLAALGYDVAEQNHSVRMPEGISEIEEFKMVIILAVKPGNDKAPSARSLMDADLDITNDIAIDEDTGRQILKEEKMWERFGYF
jgi:SAM-dependent methyltransferase